MTEKRFEIVGENFTNVDVTTYIVEYGDGDDDCFELYESKETSQKVCDKLNNILDEIEQLKQSINEVVELLSEEVDLFSEKATEHDINAYVELKELDNKDAYYMATATKKAIKMLKELL